jgi:hypothetical protein
MLLLDGSSLKAHAASSQVGALRALAKKVEATGKGLPPELAEAVADALEDREDLAGC